MERRYNKNLNEIKSIIESIKKENENLADIIEYNFETFLEIHDEINKSNKEEFSINLSRSRIMYHKGLANGTLFTLKDLNLLDEKTYLNLLECLNNIENVLHHMLDFYHQWKH